MEPRLKWKPNKMQNSFPINEKSSDLMSDGNEKEELQVLRSYENGRSSELLVDRRYTNPD